MGNKDFIADTIKLIWKTASDKKRVGVFKGKLVLIKYIRSEPGKIYYETNSGEKKEIILFKEKQALIEDFAKTLSPGLSNISGFKVRKDSDQILIEKK